MRWLGWIAFWGCTGGVEPLSSPPEQKVPDSPIDEPVEAPFADSYVIRTLTAAPQGVGLDWDGLCTPQGCADNVAGPRVWPDFARGPQDWQILDLVTAQAGLGHVRWVQAADADDDPTNNFFSEQSEPTGCCLFEVKRESLNSNDQPLWSVSARVSGGQWLVTAPGPAIVLRSVGQTLPLEQVVLRFSKSEEGLREGLLAALVPPGPLAALPGHICPLTSGCMMGSVLDGMVAVVGQPDIDRDGDGRDCFYDSNGDGRVDICCDGEGERCRGAANCSTKVPSPDRLNPGLCAQDPRMADAWSIAFNFEADPAEVTGVAP